MRRRAARSSRLSKASIIASGGTRLWDICLPRHLKGGRLLPHQLSPSPVVSTKRRNFTGDLPGSMPSLRCPPKCREVPIGRWSRPRRWRRSVASNTPGWWPPITRLALPASGCNCNRAGADAVLPTLRSKSRSDSMGVWRSASRGSWYRPTRPRPTRRCCGPAVIADLRHRFPLHSRLGVNPKGGASRGHNH
jgi:hypothetical protein